MTDPNVLAIGGLFAFFLTGTAMAFLLPDSVAEDEADRLPDDTSPEPLLLGHDARIDASLDARWEDADDIAFAPDHDAMFPSDSLADLAFWKTDESALETVENTPSRIADFRQGTDVLELVHPRGDGPADLALDPNPEGGTDVILGGRVVAVVDGVTLMGADIRLVAESAEG